VNAFWVSIREYVLAICRAWWQLAIGLAGGAFAVVSAFRSGLVVPTWVGAVVAAAALIVAQFLAFHRVRLARDRSGRLVSLPGIVNEFSGGNYWPSSRAGYVETPGHGLAVRVIVGPGAHIPSARITKELRESLPGLLASSPFEAWLQARSAPATWTLTMPMGPFFANVERDQGAEGSNDATYRAFGSFQLPTAPQSPRAFIAVDLVFTLDAEAAAPILLSLADVYELCLSLVATALDRLAPGLLPQIEPKRRVRFRQRLRLVGPSIFFYAPNGRTLADYIDLSALRLVGGATQANVQQLAAIELPSGRHLDSGASRDEFVRSGLKTMLEVSHFVDGDEYVDALPRHIV
jgi:hypothetical protein